MQTKPSLISVLDFKLYFQQILEERQAKDYRYSLRKFAQDLGVSASTMSELLNGKHVPSLKSIRKIATRLDLTQDEYDHLVDLTLLHSPYNDTLRTEAFNRIQKRQKVLVEN